jgi:alcohol dehydrogenase
MRVNLPVCTRHYACIAEAVGLASHDEMEAAERLVLEVCELSRRLHIPHFADLNIDPREFERIARYSYQNNSNDSNPRVLTQEDYLAILKEAYEGS